MGWLAAMHPPAFRSRTALLAIAALGLSCAGASSSALSAGSAAATAGLAVGVGAARLASGDCFTVCPVGTSCDRAKGTCEPLPCRGRCRDDEQCESGPVLEKCVPKKPVDLQVDDRAKAPISDVPRAP